MKVAAILALVPLWGVVALASLSEPNLCRGTCECMDGEPFVVDCTQFGFVKVPFTTTDDYGFQWVAVFRDNLITHVPQMPQQDELMGLSFAMNQVATIADSAFSDLPSLRSLDLSHCRLTRASFTVDAFKGRYNGENRHDPLPLEVLDISHNQITELDSHAFNHMVSLKSLIISNNPFHDFTLDTCRAFSELTGLEKLDISRTGQTRIPEKFLAELRSLKKLVLEGNKFRTVPQEVNFAKSLEILILDNNPIITISPALHSAFHGPPSLTTLSLCRMPSLETIEKQAFTGVSNLTLLSITHNPNLHSIHKLALLGRGGATDRLRKVYLNNNRLSSLDRTVLEWDHLDRLDLQHNPWNCDCHFSWITKGPLQRMIIAAPRLTRYIVCAAPSSVIGVNIKALMVRGYTFPCADHVGLPLNPNYYGPFIVGTIFVGILLLVFSTMLCTYVLYQKSRATGLSGQAVRYHRPRGSDLQPVDQSVYT